MDLRKEVRKERMDGRARAGFVWIDWRDWILLETGLEVESLD